MPMAGSEADSGKRKEEAKVQRKASESFKIGLAASAGVGEEGRGREKNRKVQRALQDQVHHCHAKETSLSSSSYQKQEAKPFTSSLSPQNPL